MKGTADGSFTTLAPKCPNYLVMDASASGWGEFRTPPCGGEIIRTKKNITLLYTVHSSSSAESDSGFWRPGKSAKEALLCGV